MKRLCFRVLKKHDQRTFRLQMRRDRIGVPVPQQAVNQSVEVRTKGSARWRSGGSPFHASPM